jgi:tetratricopeptide (TPR) repeat protein
LFCGHTIATHQIEEIVVAKAKKNVLTQGKKRKAEQLALANQLEAACGLYAGVCASDPADVESWVKLSIVQCGLYRFSDAEGSVRRALRLTPDLTFAQQTLATILQRQGRTDEASVVLEAALAQRPDSAEMLSSLARLREQQGRTQEAFELYFRALDLQPETAYGLAKKAELHERQGNLSGSEACVVRGLAQFPTHPELNLAAARLDRRADRYSDAAARLDAVIHSPMSEDCRADMHIMLGQLHDRLGNTDRVLPHLLHGKAQIARAANPADRSRQRFFSRVAAAHACLEGRAGPVPSPASAPVFEAPVFLVGFQRSGTTLLEQILDSHPHLQCLTEKPMAEMMEAAFHRMGASGPLMPADLSDGQLADLRAVYWREAARHCDRQAGTSLVDKQPLNILRIPLIQRVFPEARFILAIRHPCDVSLGCLMQKFGYDNVMSCFADLPSIAEAYTRVMDVWMECERKLPLRWKRMRYEDLVEDVEGEMRALLDFLGLDWNESLLRHADHAKQRGLINTPSYHQVTQPIYRHARFRWQRYAHEFVPVMSRLQPYIEHFGYA